MFELQRPPRCRINFLGSKKFGASVHINDSPTLVLPPTVPSFLVQGPVPERAVYSNIRFLDSSECSQSATDFVVHSRQTAAVVVDPVAFRAF